MINAPSQTETFQNEFHGFNTIFGWKTGLFTEGKRPSNDEQRFIEPMTYSFSIRQCHPDCFRVTLGTYDAIVFLFWLLLI